MFSCVLIKFYVEKFEGFDPKNLQGAFHSRAPGSLWELSFSYRCRFPHDVKPQSDNDNKIVIQTRRLTSLGAVKFEDECLAINDHGFGLHSQLGGDFFYKQYCPTIVFVIIDSSVHTHTWQSLY